MTYNRTMRAAFIRFLRFLAWIELASVPVIYWTRGYLVWVFGPVGMTDRSPAGRWLTALHSRRSKLYPLVFPPVLILVAYS